ncbi:MAG: MopE-related protein [Myxococcota bacterium]
MRSSLILLSMIPLMTLACDNGEEVEDTDGEEVVAIPDIALSTNTLTFGEVKFGEEKLFTLEFQNRGDGDLLVERLEIQPPPPAGWTVQALSASSFQVIPGLPVNVTFKCVPGLEPVQYRGQLVISSNDPDEDPLTANIVCDLQVDADGDGFADDTIPGGDDCDDTDPTINPGAEDVWYDGIDQNCDGANDFDQDGDGFVAAPFNPDSSIYAGTAEGGGDCQDNNPLIWPDHINYNLVDVNGDPLFVQNPNEVWYDGTDSNCDEANDYDQDGDGFSSLAQGRGSDCNDTDPLVNVDAFEMLNGEDDNCDGFVDQDVPGWNSDNYYEYLNADFRLGFSLVVGDLNEDGFDEIITGAPGTTNIEDQLVGQVIVFDGERVGDAASGSLTFNEEQNTIEGFTSTGIGTGLAFYDDAFGNGNPDLAIGAATYNGNRGIVYVMDNQAYYNGDLSDAFAEIFGDTSGQQVGYGMGSNIELNGDGIDDHFGHYYRFGTHALYLLYGGVRGSYALPDVDARFLANGSNGVGARAMGPSGDLDGDGYEDTVFCSPDANSRGQVWVLWGSATRYTSAEESLTTVGTLLFEGERFEQMGKICGIGPDYNDDGLSELWVQSIDAGGPRTGIYMINGSADLRNSYQEVDEIYNRKYETSSTDVGAITFGLAGDWDGDELDDVAFGLDRAGVAYGRVWFFGSDAVDGDYSAGLDSLASVSGDDAAYQESYGAAISPLPGDFNDDGKADFVAGDPFFSADFGNELYSGAIYVSFQK